MENAIIIFILWCLFGGSHIIVSSSAIRPNLVKRYGERGFTLLYTAITVFTMLPLIYFTAKLAGQGAAGPNLSAYIAARWAMGLMAALGAILMIASLIDFPNSSIAQLSQRRRLSAAKQAAPLPPPSPIERISRHPFFIGLSILAISHLLLSATLAQAIYFGGFAALSLAGFYFQDRKLRRQWQAVYAEFEANTDALSLPIIGKQPAAKDNEKPTSSGMKTWIIAAITVLLLFGAGHSFWSYANGAPLAAAILLFGFLATIAALLKKG